MQTGSDVVERQERLAHEEAKKTPGMTFHPGPQAALPRGWAKAVYGTLRGGPGKTRVWTGVKRKDPVKVNPKSPEGILEAKRTELRVRGEKRYDALLGMMK